MSNDTFSSNKRSHVPCKTSLPGDGRGAILVLDGNVEVRAVLAAMLAANGYCVTMARNGDEALGHFTTAQKRGNAYYAVILNLHSTIGMNGTAVMSALLALDPHVRAILMSGDIYHPAVADHREWGFMAVLTKPFTLEKLLEILAVLDGQREYGDG